MGDIVRVDDMLMALIPLFDENMAVCAYSIFSQKNNYLLNPMLLGTGQNDGAMRVTGLEMIQKVGLETMSGGKEIFVPVNNMAVFADIESQCDAPRSKIVLLFDNTIPPVEMYLNRLKELKARGYKLAVRKLAVSEFEAHRPILQLMDYVFINSRKVALDKAKIYFEKLYPDAKLCAGNLESVEVFEAVKAQGGYDLFEGNFYRMPVTKGQNEVAPLKVNYIELLNIVNNNNFELTQAADIIGRDTALTISLLKIVNRIAINSEITSIRHAAAMLGQRELKKWINTAVVNELYADKPSEITRVSLLRAKFAENLAAAFGIAMNADELFLMGIFSVLDVILDKSMAEALEIVQVSKKISDALIHGQGELAQVLDFIKQYEAANWPEVSRQMVLKDIHMNVINDAYQDSLCWYQKITAGTK